MNITSGIIERPLKCILYGPEGIGKSTFASQFPDPVFIDTEGSTAHLDVRRFEGPTSYTMLLQQIKYVVQNPSVCKTLVIDTADWAEKLCKEQLLAEMNWDSIETPGYGKGYTILQEYWAKMLEALNEVIKAGVHVLLTAHAMMRKFEQPDEMGAYDRWELKLEKKTAPITKEWADMVLFANYKTDVITDEKTKSKKAVGGRRVIYTTHHPAWDAKNRAGLPEEINLDFKDIAHLFTYEQPKIESQSVNVTPNSQVETSVSTPPTQQEIQQIQSNNIPESLADLMRVNFVTEEEIQQVVFNKGYFPKSMPISDYDPAFIEGVLVGAWDQVFKEIEASRTGLPFDL